MADWKLIEIGTRASYDGIEPIYGPLPDATGRTECHRVAERSATIVVVGQSNAANFAAGRYTAGPNVVNFNIYDGRCYPAVDPLIGASGDSGHFATRLGDFLIERGLAKHVTLAPIGMGNTRIEDWSSSGVFNYRILVLIRRLYEAHLKPDLILWQQGEGNREDNDPGGIRYRDNLIDVVTTFRRYGIDAPFMIALCTLCRGHHPNAAFIRTGQLRAVNPQLGTFLGPDTDQIGSEDRYDGCHMSESGVRKQAEMWADAIATLKQALPWTT
jgi:hypothetical protein